MADTQQLGVFLLATSGMAMTALGLDRHWLDLVGRRRAVSHRHAFPLRLAAVACWAGALILAITNDGTAIGVILWITALTTGAFAVALSLTLLSLRKPRRRHAAKEVR
ncbi:uncharacterized protein DUF3325 [Nitrospirillum amazonense]|uniref:Uncharacterized protein DUF3325 n=1 Tax=Nitrospirillum amazonense TaxID=28077 RepID=A0A560EN18_9PROT|nr:DUF3325 domain-containing protein [Nitrospirillum amazonense]TWB10718.1 uncharacterized protein DUF3325 [Nitrospirillum amazonense]